MRNTQTHHVAHGRFEAARVLRTTNPSLAVANRHGHGFGITAIGTGQEGFDALSCQLQNLCAPLHYQDLNEVLSDGCDNRSILRFFANALKSHAIRALQLQTEPCLLATWSAMDSGFRVKKTFRFEAAHQLPNVPKGHKCGRMHGHGFSVSIEVRAPDNGLLETTQESLDGAWAPLGKMLQWSCLNDIKGLENPTSEHLAMWLWQKLDHVEDLLSVSVHETPTAGCLFDGARMRIWKEQTFDSAIQLTHLSAGDPRRAIHGHTFATRLHLAGAVDEVLGWVYDYGDVKQAFKPLFESLDHRPLYEIPGLENADDPTLATYIYQHMKPILPSLCGVDIEHRPAEGAWLIEQGSRHDL